jgi:hypothetical protein
MVRGRVENKICWKGDLSFRANQPGNDGKVIFPRRFHPQCPASGARAQLLPGSRAGDAFSRIRTWEGGGVLGAVSICSVTIRARWFKGADMSADCTFNSKCDVWLIWLVAGAAMLAVGAGLGLRVFGVTHGVVLLLGWGLITSLLVVGLGLPRRYTLRSDRLYIRSGWLEWDGPARPLAWSLDRLRLDYAAGGFILGSSDDRAAFLQELAARCPHLALCGDILKLAHGPLHEKKHD